MGLLQQYGAGQGTVSTGNNGRVLSGGPKILRHIKTEDRKAASGGTMASLTFEVEASTDANEIGAQVVENLNVKHSNPETVRIAINQAATIVHAALGSKDADDDSMPGCLLYVENAPKESVSKKAGDVDASTGKQKVYKNNEWRWATKNEDRIRIARLLNAQPPTLFPEDGAAPAGFAPQGYAPTPQAGYAPQSGYVPQQQPQQQAFAQTQGYVPQQQAPVQHYQQPMQASVASTQYAQQPQQQQMHQAVPQGYGQPAPAVGHMPPQGVGAWGAA